MHLHRPSLYLSSLLAIGLPALCISTSSMADVWVFEPTAAIDQRLDDNYTISPTAPDKVSATRVVGTLSLSREAPAASFTGLLRVDGLLTQSDNARDGELASNQVGFLSSEFRRARAQYGIDLTYKNDTPSRDISADLTDISSVAADTGASVTQEQNVARQRFVIAPNFRYNLTRRTTFESELTYTTMKHALPSAEDALRAQFALIKPLEPIPDPITIDDTGFFTVLDELDDYTETALDVGIKSKLTPISTVSFFAGFSNFVADTEPDQRVIFAFEDTIQDTQNKDIRRKPKRQRRSTTSKFRIGYDQAITPTLNVGVQVGIYSNETDDTDLLRIDDNASFGDPGNPETAIKQQAAIDELVTKSSGYLANISATKSTGITRYTAKFGVDVLPSSEGSQVESLEAVGDLLRQMGPLLDFSFRIRAYEPNAFNAFGTSAYSRRFLSMEPKLIWRFNRAWTVAGSYRYRRQKSRRDTESGVSNALLFSLKYTPPSAIRDAALNK